MTRNLEEDANEFTMLFLIQQRFDEQTQHLMNESTIAMMKKDAMLINSSRGGFIDTRAVTSALRDGHLGYLGLGVYEQEEQLFSQPGRGSN